MNRDRIDNIKTHINLIFGREAFDNIKTLPVLHAMYMMLLNTMINNSELIEELKKLDSFEPISVCNGCDSIRDGHIELCPDKICGCSQEHLYKKRD